MIIIDSVAAAAISVAVLGMGYLWLPPELVGAATPMTAADRLVFALRWDLPILMWLAGSVGAGSRKRFWNAADRPGSAYSAASPVLAVRRANLQNTIQQARIKCVPAASPRPDCPRLRNGDDRRARRLALVLAGRLTSCGADG
ncbi:MAG: hypothetical protein K2Z80_35070 [Xanthobacteraceae bacterium]|nr:hypothetical protein [Xanthobacteraceae bacterium]